MLPQGWNHMIGQWLKHYIHVRTPKKYIPTLITFMVSAFWHGFYEAYYYVFFSFFLTNMASKAFFKRRAYFNWIPYHLKHLIC